MSNPIEPAATFCQCDYPKIRGLRVVGGVLVHVDGCGLPMECEFSYLTDDPPHAARTTHVDYVVCAEHESAAISNVYDRDHG